MASPRLLRRRFRRLVLRGIFLLEFLWVGGFLWRRMVFRFVPGLILVGCTPVAGSGGSFVADIVADSAVVDGDAGVPDSGASDSFVVSDSMVSDSGLADSVDPRGGWSCEGRCSQTEAGVGANCQCDPGCSARDDCCFDWASLCASDLLSCAGRCGAVEEPGLPCQCHSVCGKDGFGECCGDWVAECSEMLLTCEGRCGAAYDPLQGCQCSPDCDSFSNCCSDFSEICLPVLSSCVDRCEVEYDPALPCQCGLSCAKFGSCCPGRCLRFRVLVLHLQGVRR